MISIVKAVRRPFEVDCVQVTSENMEEVAEWCMGNLNITDKADKFIKVRVHSPLTERQTKAFAGDWVLYANKGFKVYTEKAFNNAFELEEFAEVKNVLDNNEPRTDIEDVLEPEPRSGYTGPVPPVNAGIVEGTVEKVQFFGAVAEDSVE